MSPCLSKCEVRLWVVETVHGRQYFRQRGVAVGSGDEQCIPCRRSEFAEPPGKSLLKSGAERHGLIRERRP